MRLRSIAATEARPPALPQPARNAVLHPGARFGGSAMAMPAKTLSERQFTRAYETEIKVEPVKNRDELAQFVKFQWTIYAGDPHWVPPLFMERMDFLNPD